MAADPKGSLINLSRELKCDPPSFHSQRSGPDHMPTWTAYVTWRGRTFSAVDTRRVDAECEAANAALAHHQGRGAIFINDWHLFRQGDGREPHATNIVFSDIPLEYPPFVPAEMPKMIGAISIVVERDELKKVTAALCIVTSLCQAMVDGAIAKLPIIVNLKHESAIIAPIRELYPSLSVDTFMK